jgi:hypothetical protein
MFDAYMLHEHTVASFAYRSSLSVLLEIQQHRMDSDKDSTDTDTETSTDSSSELDSPPRGNAKTTGKMIIVEKSPGLINIKRTTSAPKASSSTSRSNSQGTSKEHAEGIF